jgi:hypothetical protein
MAMVCACALATVLAAGVLAAVVRARHGATRSPVSRWIAADVPCRDAAAGAGVGAR